MTKIVKELAQGRLLISEPLMKDDFFKRSVILLSEHDEKGSVGFILNKLTDLSLNEAVKDFPDFDAPLYFGGPVDSDMLFYIHKLGDKLKDSRQIADGIYWGGDYDQLKFLIDTHQVKPNEIRFYVGYSGWTPNQLENELKENSWVVGDSKIDFTFYEDAASLWSKVLRSMGKEYAMLANYPEDPSWN